MTSPEAKKLWRRAIKEHFNCQCVYCGETYEFNELHQLVTQEFLDRVKSGEATTQDLKAACDWLKSNDISGVAYDGNPLSKLAEVMPQIDPSLVKRKVYGKNF